MFEQIRPFGIEGVELHAGDHLCALHDGPFERDEILVPYVREGLRSGDKCMVVVDRPDGSSLLSALGDDELVAASLKSGQLDIRAIRDAPVLADGPFAPENLCRFWAAELAPAMESGTYPFARVGGEAGWWLNTLPELSELVHYESVLNRYMHQFPQSTLCVYDLGCFGEGVIVDMVMTHPHVIVHGVVVDNPYYLDPDEFLLIRRAPEATHLGDEIRAWYDEVSAR